jgi:hypothetical protein
MRATKSTNRDCAISIGASGQRVRRQHFARGAQTQDAFDLFERDSFKPLQELVDGVVAGLRPSDRRPSDIATPLRRDDHGTKDGRGKVSWGYRK